MKTFKKYNNRKIYSSEVKGYVNLPHILDLVKAGENVQVLTHEEGRDVTSEVLREAVMRSPDVSTEQLLGLVRG